MPAKSVKGGWKVIKKDGKVGTRLFKSKSAALAAQRAGRNAGRSAPSTPRNNKPGWGRWSKMGRTIDIVSGPFQAGITSKGASKEGLLVSAELYTGGLVGRPGRGEAKFHANVAKNTYGGMGTGLAHDYARSQMGVYRGVGQKKIISGVIAALPEILAYGEQDPFENPERFNSIRTAYDRGYSTSDGTWSISPSNTKGSRFWTTIGGDVALRAIQHLIFDTTGPIGLNRMLGKGVNA